MEGVNGDDLVDLHEQLMPNARRRREARAAVGNAEIIRQLVQDLNEELGD